MPSGETVPSGENGGRSQTPGLDLDVLRDYLDRACPGLVTGPLRATLVAGGKSNLTYAVTDGRGHWIVRRPPLGHVLATAHDMTREYRVISGLAGTDVPVPATYLLCEEQDVLGAPFYLMAEVAGTPYRSAAELGRLGAARTRTVATRMVDTLAALHAVDARAVGLADFGRPVGFLGRQVRRWKKQLDASHSRDLPGADELHAALAADVPAESAASIVHGDYRLDNLLVDDADEVTAVLDWEMATLGDPLADVALLVAYQRLAHLDTGSAVADAATAPGFLTEDEVLARYAQCSGRDLSRIDFHLGLAYFKVAAILEGIHYRYTHGQTVGEGFDTVGDAVGPLIEAGLTTMGHRPT